MFEPRHPILPGREDTKDLRAARSVLNKQNILVVKSAVDSVRYLYKEPWHNLGRIVKQFAHQRVGVIVAAISRLMQPYRIQIAFGCPGPSRHVLPEEQVALAFVKPLGAATLKFRLKFCCRDRTTLFQIGDCRLKSLDERAPSHAELRQKLIHIELLRLAHKALSGEETPELCHIANPLASAFPS